MEIILKYLLSIIWLISLAHSQIINGVAIQVNNIPITLYDIKVAQKELGKSKAEVVQLLIQNALEESESQRFHLEATDKDVELYISKIMAQNRIPTKDAFFQALKYQGISKDDFLKNIKRQVIKPKLYQRISASQIIPPTDKELKHLYALDISNIKSKYTSFEEAKNELQNMFFIKQQQRILKNYFSKVRAESVIEYIR